MTVSSVHQINVFIISILSGVCCAVIFDFQRSIRRVYGASALHTAIQDFIFTLICIAASIGVGLHYNKGEIRYFEIMGAAAGALIYFGTLSRLMLRLLCLCHVAFVRIFIKPIISFFKLFLVPLTGLQRMIRKTYGLIRKKFKAKLRIFHSVRKMLKKRIKML